MAVINANTNQISELARLMRAEAEGEGRLGMLMVGNVGVNRVIADCLDFKNIRTLPHMIYQSPGGFEAIQKPYFFQHARQKEINLAKQVIKGWKYHPASHALWFFMPGGACPAYWFNQPNVGQYKSHCFYQPLFKDCPNIFY